MFYSDLLSNKILLARELKQFLFIHRYQPFSRYSSHDIAQLLPKIQATLVEIYAHPDRLPNAVNPTGPLELQALLSPNVRDRLQKEGFQLVNYHQIKLPN